MLDESASMKLCDPVKPRGVPDTQLSQLLRFSGHAKIPKRPKRFSSIFVVAVVCPPIEKLGSEEIGLPVHRVPIVERIVLRSSPMPKTMKILVNFYCVLQLNKPLFIASEVSSS